VANILLPPLLALVHRLSAAVRPGGKLCLSGVLVDQVSFR
jgi:ribosomal protein L11 methylase PrmA